MNRKFRRLPSIDSGSMADIAFLLLIFFLVVTTISKDEGIPTKLPPYSPDFHSCVLPPPQKNILSVKINKADQLLVEGEELSIHKLRNFTKEFLTNNGKKPNFSSSPTKAIISLQNDRGTSYNAYISVYNELLGAYHEIWDSVAKQQYKRGYKTLTKGEQFQIRKKFPLVISEAEPSDFAEL